MIVLVSSIILMFLSYHLKSSIAYLFVTIKMKTIYMLIGQVMFHTEMLMISNRFFNHMTMYTVVASINCT